MNLPERGMETASKKKKFFLWKMMRLIVTLRLSDFAIDFNARDKIKFRKPTYSKYGIFKRIFLEKILFSYIDYIRVFIY